MIAIPEAVNIVTQRKIAWIRALLGNLSGIHEIDFATNIITKNKPLNLWPVIIPKKGKLKINIPVVPWEIGYAMAGKIKNTPAILRKVYQATLN